MLRRSLFLAVAVLLLSCVASAKNGAPNVLFLMSDSYDGRVLDPTSKVSARVHTPFFDHLASTGVNFVRTYPASPQCVPSRTTMFTGRHTHNIKCWNNGLGVAVSPSNGEVDSNCATFWSHEQCREFGNHQNVTATLLDDLTKAGHRPHLYGKVDVGAGIITQKDESNATANGFHGGPDTATLSRSADIRRATKHDPLNMTNDQDAHVHPEDWRTIEKCMEFLQQTSPDSDSNWFLYCSLNIPHPPFNTNATWLAYVNESLVDVPTWLPEDQFHPADSYMSESKSVWRNYTDEEIIKVRKTYYAMCAETDYMLGLVYETARVAGHLDNTYVIFVSDHGEMNMEHRQVWKNSMYEASARVPLIIAGPGVPQGVVVRDMVSLLDIYPTLLEIVGAAIPGYLEGHSLMPYLQPSRASEVAARPDFVISQYHSNMGNTGSYMVRRGKYKYITFGHYLSPFSDYKPQLFDVDSDPEELNDLAAALPDVVQVMDYYLRTVLDPEAADEEAKKQDLALFQKYINVGDKQKLRHKLERAYKGFDDGDMAKIEQWLLGAALPLQSA